VRVNCRVSLVPMATDLRLVRGNIDGVTTDLVAERKLFRDQILVLQDAELGMFLGHQARQFLVVDFPASQ